MRACRFLVAAILGAIATLAVSGTADAATVSVRCDLNPTTALASAISSNPAGTVFAITGMCQETIQIAGSLSLINHAQIHDLVSDDGIEGELVIAGPYAVVIDGITLEGTATDTGLPDVLDVSGSATVTIQNAQITNGQRIGLNVDGGATAQILNTTISGNGVAQIAGETDAIRAVSAALKLGATATGSDGTVIAENTVTVSSNVGNGIALLGHSHLTMAGGFIRDNGGNQAFVAGKSDLELFETEVIQSQTPSTPGAFAIQALSGSTVGLFGGVVTGRNVAGAILVASGGSLLMNGATLDSTSPSLPTIQISGGSNAVMGGANDIENEATIGTVLQIDHASSFQQTPLSRYSLPQLAGSLFAGTDLLFGAALVQEQSQMDIGMGLFTGAGSPGGSPSLTWFTGTGECILVQQNSSIRLSGGVTISGGDGEPCALNGGAVSTTIVIQQGSNGFFNLAQGGTNVIEPGSVSCAFAGIPNAHVTGKGNITPPSAQPVMIGGLEQALNATSPGCLGP